MAARLERHLAGCAACRAQCEDLSFAARMVADLPAPEAEPAMAPHWLSPEGEPQRLVNRERLFSSLRRSPPCWRLQLSRRGISTERRAIRGLSRDCRAGR